VTTITTNTRVRISLRAPGKRWPKVWLTRSEMEALVLCAINEDRAWKASTKEHRSLRTNKLVEMLNRGNRTYVAAVTPHGRALADALMEAAKIHAAQEASP